jgi:hypothetical protein
VASSSISPSDSFDAREQLIRSVHDMHRDACSRKSCTKTRSMRDPAGDVRC